MDRPVAFKASDWLKLGTISLLLFALSGGTAITLTWLDIQQRLQINQSVIHTLLNQRMNNLDAALVSLVGQVHNDTEAPERISRFARSLSPQFKSLQTVLLVKPVNSLARPVYEAQRRENGLRQFTLKQSSQQAELTQAEGRDWYYPVDFIEPVTPTNARLIGLDLSSLPALQQIISHSIASGRIVASRPLQFMGDSGSSYFLAKVIYQHAYALDPAAVSQQDIAGIALFQINPSLLLPELAQDTQYDFKLYANQQPLPIWQRAATPQGWLHLPQANFTQKLQAHDQDWQYQLSYQLYFSDFTNRSLAIAAALAAVLSLGFGIAYRIIRLGSLRHQQTRNQLFEQREKARVALHTIADAVIITDPQGWVDFINPAAEKLLQHPAQVVQNHPLNLHLVITNEDNPEQQRDPVQLCLQNPNQPYQSDCDQLQQQNGESLSLHISASAIHDANGKVGGVVLVLRDISHSRKLAKKMSHEATHDQLTGLINRRGFEHALESALESVRHECGQHVLCFLDLDKFKPVNDSCGHQAGDELLKLITANIKKHIRRNDILARIGGDEFGLLLSDCPLSHATEIAEKIREEVRATQFFWNGQVFQVGASIGMAVLDQQMRSITEVVNAADTACYLAKDNGRDQVCLFDGQHQPPNNDTSQWPDRIRKALSQNQFVLLTQVIVPLGSSNAPPMLEFLIRLKTSTGRLAPPKAFLPAAERYDLMYDIDLWVINQALAIISQQPVNAPLLYTINLSAAALAHADLGRVIEQALARHQVKPQQLCFETTEAAINQHHDSALQIINRLRSLGCLFAVDNFGAGLSSLNHLKQLPLDFIKIDGSLIRNIGHDLVDKSMVRTISHVGHMLNLRIVAECVETDTTLALLDELGVDYAQGFHISQPDDDIGAPTRLH